MILFCIVCIHLSTELQVNVLIYSIQVILIEIEFPVCIMTSSISYVNIQPLNAV
jgi:hypothetical protein